MTPNRIRHRLEQLEREQQRAATQEAEYHCRMMHQLQQELGLPLPDDVPAEVTQEAERRIIAVQAALRANRDDHGPLHEFRAWGLSIHEKYGGDNAKR